jgi:hypothetical protein
MFTPDIFDFDTEQLQNWDEGRTRKALEDHPALYINHLTIARRASGSADKLADNSTGGEFDKGFAAALREVTAHLRQSDFLPGGDLTTDERVSGSVISHPACKHCGRSAMSKRTFGTVRQLPSGRYQARYL